MMKAQASFFADERLDLERSLELTAESLNSYGRQYQHWAMAFSGGKDSTATVTVIAHLIETGRVHPPKSLTAIYADARLELPPLHIAAMSVMETLQQRGVQTRIVLSRSKDGAECGQGYFQQSTPASVADTLAPIVHWRVCHVWDWLNFFAPDLGFNTSIIADAYGGDEAAEVNARTGCVGCPVASKETSLDRVLRNPNWRYLTPLKRLKPLYDTLSLPRNRLRRNSDTFGPLIMDAQHFGLSEVLTIQSEVNACAAIEGRTPIDILNEEEVRRIDELIAANTWPDKWTGTEMAGSDLLRITEGNDVHFAAITRKGGKQFVMPGLLED